MPRCSVTLPSEAHPLRAAEGTGSRVYLVRQVASNQRAIHLEPVAENVHTDEQQEGHVEAGVLQAKQHKQAGCC